MKKNEVVLGGIYQAKVSNKIVDVRIKSTQRLRKAVQLPQAPAIQRITRASARKTIFGHSACAVLKALGRAGMKYQQADAILKRHSIEMPKASVSVQLGFGRNEHTWQRHGKPADLTAAQMKELGVGQ